MPNDATAHWDTMSEEVSDEVVKAIRELTPKVANRPLGSMKVPKDLLREEWELRDETFWQTKHAEAMEDPESGGNEIRALLLIAQHDAEMQKGKK